MAGAAMRGASTHRPCPLSLPERYSPLLRQQPRQVQNRGVFWAIAEVVTQIRTGFIYPRASALLSICSLRGAPFLTFGYLNEARVFAHIMARAGAARSQETHSDLHVCMEARDIAWPCELKGGISVLAGSQCWNPCRSSM